MWPDFLLKVKQFVAAATANNIQPISVINKIRHVKSIEDAMNVIKPVKAGRDIRYSADVDMELIKQ